MIRIRWSVFSLVLLASLSIGAFAQAQTREITGRVTTTVTGQPLPGASVALAGQTSGVRTNERGEFRIRVPESDVSIVARAMRRAGVKCPSRSAAHVLGHSVASSMLHQGASLQEIAVILRHRSVQTTEIYAKVDVTSLRAIIQPWPEVKSC